MPEIKVLSLVPRLGRMARSVSDQVGTAGAVRNIEDSRTQRSATDQRVDQALREIAKRHHPSGYSPGA